LQLDQEPDEHHTALPKYEGSSDKEESHWCTDEEAELSGEESEEKVSDGADGE
jgi:hypothetical protein